METKKICKIFVTGTLRAAEYYFLKGEKVGSILSSGG